MCETWLLLFTLLTINRSGFHILGKYVIVFMSAAYLTQYDDVHFHSCKTTIRKLTDRCNTFLNKAAIS
jgi:hypothetical protein